MHFFLGAVRVSSLFCVPFKFNNFFWIILLRKRELVALLKLSCGCLYSVHVSFFTIHWVNLQSVFVAFPAHNHFLFCIVSYFHRENCECIYLYSQ